MELVVISAEDFLPDESAMLQYMLAGGLDWLHLRKPGGREELMRQLISNIPPQYYGQVIVHGHTHLQQEFGLGGFHVEPERLPEAVSAGVQVSVSAHSATDFRAVSELATRVFISPVFDSISKPGYRGNTDLVRLAAAARRNTLVALGGVTPEGFPQLDNWGFDAAALLGYVWLAPDPRERFLAARRAMTQLTHKQNT
jgi:thiamine monophosphate synthase